jgi:hypothetical protein
LIFILTLILTLTLALTFRTLTVKEASVLASNMSLIYDITVISPGDPIPIFRVGVTVGIRVGVRVRVRVRARVRVRCYGIRLI